MKKGVLKSILSVVLILVICIFPVSAYGLSGEVQYEFINELADYIVKNYKFGTSKEVLLNAVLEEKLNFPEGGFNDMVAAMMSVLDENSSYMTEEEYKSMLEHSITGEFSGIGVTITTRNERVIVVSPIIGSPAYDAGIQPNDIIVSVNEENVEGASMEYIKSLIVGTPGTEVTVGILRGESILQFSLVRAEVLDVPVTHEIRDNIGYIQITAFNNNTVDAVKAALKDFDGNGIDRLILDLRYNSGGELNAAVEMCKLFAPKGVVAKIEFMQTDKNEVYFSELESSPYKVAVIVNNGSASASELFSGTLQDTGAARVFGTTTYGKGTVQQLLPLVTGGCVRLTTAEYLTAGGRSINKKGVQPDVYVENTRRVPDTSHFVDIDFTKTLEKGSNSAGVLALEQRLTTLGYMDEADNLFDQETEDALKTFQAYQGLTASGVADFYTLFNISGVDFEVPFPVDSQYNMAVEYLNSLN